MFISPAQTSDIPKLAQLEYHDYQEEATQIPFFFSGNALAQWPSLFFSLQRSIQLGRPQFLVMPTSSTG